MHGQDPIASVVRSLKRARRLSQLMLLGQRAMFIIALAAATALVFGALDFLLRLPEWIRIFNLVAGVAILAALFVFVLGPAWRFAPSLTEMALRIERRRPELRGLLASAVEFHRRRERGEPDGPMEKALEELVVRRAAEQWTAADASVLRPTRFINGALRLAGLAAVFVIVVAMRPDLASIGASRLFAPWADAEWPRRTAVADVTETIVHPLGAALPLRAALTRTPRDADSTYVSVQYRMIEDSGRAGPLRTALMTHQRRDVDLPPGASRTGATRGALFERLVEADASAVEFRFRTSDDETAWRRIRIVPPPAVVEAHARITPPEYAARLRGEGDAAGAMSAPTEIEMGAGLDERAIAPSSLAGSRVEWTLKLNKAIPAPQSPGQDESWLASTLGADAPGAELDIEVDGATWKVSWTLERTARFPVALRDEHGIESIDEPVFRFEALQDAPASATVVDPAADEAVLPTATITLIGEGRDDVGLEAVWLERQVAKRAGEREPSVPGGALEAQGEPETIARSDASGSRLARVESSVDLAALGVEPGDEVWIAAVALDVLASETGRREATRSALRRLRIISEADFIDDVRAELSAVRQAAIRADEQQGEALERTGQRRADRQTRTAQTQIGERLARQSETLDRLAQSVERNALGDRALSDLLQETRSAMRSAAESSDRAARALDEAAAEARQNSPDADEIMSDEQSREVRADQERVRDELARLIEALDAGQDTWVARRQIEQMLGEQRALRERTEQAGAATAGREAQDLTAQEQSDLEQIVEAQQELAERARRMTEELPERAEQIQQEDPGAAAGLQRAGQRARQENLPENLRQASQSASENRLNDAARAQRQAEQTLEQMMDEIERDERARQEQLRRELASLIQSIEALVITQEQEIALLDGAIERGEALRALDEGMIRLNRNTLGVSDQARAAGRELVTVVRLLSRAGDAQTRAIAGLRAEAPAAEAILLDEDESLDRLREARDEAARLDQQQQDLEQQQKKAELRAAYRALLERQTAVQKGIRPLADAAELDRRDRATARELAADQTSIRRDLADVLASSEELEEAKVIEYTHQALDEATARAANALAEARPAPALSDATRAVAYLQGLLEALREDEQGDQQFAEGAGGGGGGGGGGSGASALVPPVAELKLLRSLQAQVMIDTRLVGDGVGGAADIERLGKAQRDLVELGQNLMQRLQQQGGGPAPEMRPLEPQEGAEPGPEEPNPNPEPDPAEQNDGGAS